MWLYIDWIDFVGAETMMCAEDTAVFAAQLIDDIDTNFIVNEIII